MIACETRARCQIAVDNVDKVAGDTGLFHALPAWLLFVVLYVSGCETIDWSSIPLLSLFVTSMSTFGTSPSLCLHSATLLMFTSLNTVFYWSVCQSRAARCVAVLKCAMTSGASLTYPHFMHASFLIALPLYVGQSVSPHSLFPSTLHCLTITVIPPEY